MSRAVWVISVVQSLMVWLVSSCRPDGAYNAQLDSDKWEIALWYMTDYNSCLLVKRSGSNKICLTPLGKSQAGKHDSSQK